LRPAAIGDLARTLRCDRSNVSRLLDRAAARGLVRRHGDEEDGRVTVVQLPPEGETLARRFLVALEAQTAALRERCSGQRQQLAVGLLNEVSDTLEAAKQPSQRRKRPAA